MKGPKTGKRKNVGVTRQLEASSLLQYDDLSWKAVFTVHAFVAVFDMLPHEHGGNISRNAFTKIYCDLCSFWQQFHKKSVNTSTDKEADSFAVYISKYSDEFLYAFYEVIHRANNLQPGCYCHLHFSWQNHNSFYTVD